jgi:hypothetical protein
MQTVIRIDFDKEVSELRTRIVGAIHDVLEQHPDKEIDFSELDGYYEIDGTGSEPESLVFVGIECGVVTPHSQYDFHDLGTDDLISIYGDVCSVSQDILN